MSIRKQLKKQLPNTKTAILNFDYDLLLNALFNRYTEIDDELDGLKDPTRDDIKTVLDVILKQIKDITPKCDGKNILVPITCIHQDFDTQNQFTARTESSLYKTKGIKHSKKYLHDTKENWSDDLNHSASLAGYAYEFESWENILGYLVYTPTRFCQFELAEFYADILWEMTFFGISQDEHEEKAKEITDTLNERVKEVDEAIEKEKETGEKQFISFKDALADLGLEDYYKKKYPTKNHKDYKDRMLDIHAEIWFLFHQKTIKDLCELYEKTKKTD